MANNADGSIFIDTRVDSSPFLKSIAEMRKSFASTWRRFGSMVDRQAHAMSDAYAQVSQTATQSARQLDAALAKTEKRISTVKGKLTEYYKAADAIKASTDESLRQTTTDDQAARLLEIEEIQIQQVNEQYAAQLELLKSLEAEQQRLAAAREAANAQPDSPDSPDGESGSVWTRLAARFKTAASSVAEAARNLAVSALRKVAVAAKDAARAMLRLTAKSLVDGVRRLGGWLSGAARSLLLFGRQSRKAKGSLGASFKTLLKYGLGIRSIYALFNKLRSAIKEGFGNLAQYSSAVNQSISSVLSSLTKLKNQLAAAFAPLVEIAAPVLKNLVDGLTNASVELAQLIAAMTGKSTFTKAKDVQEDYAKSLENTADKAKETKKQLAGFDELEILKDDSKDSGKTDPKDMFEESEIPEEIETLAEAINTAFSFIDGFAWNFHWDSLGTAIMDTLEGVCDNLDWTLINHAVQGVASGFAETLNTIFARRETWEKVGATIAAAINTVIDAALTFTAKLGKAGFQQIGETVAAGVNTAIASVRWADAGLAMGRLFGGAITTMATFIRSISWGDIVKAIHDFLVNAIKSVDFGDLLLAVAVPSLISAVVALIASHPILSLLTGAILALGPELGAAVDHMISTIQWVEVGQKIGGFVISALSRISAALQSVDWDNLGHHIAILIENMHVGAIVQAAIKVINAVLSAITKTLHGMLEEWFGPVGADIIGGLLYGILAVIGGAALVSWVAKNLFGPIWKAICFVFGIHSPAKEMMPLGENITLGLFEGMKSGAEGLDKILKKSIVQPIQKFFKNPIGTIKLAVDDTWTATQQVWESVKDSEATKTILGYIQRTFDSAKDTFDELKSGSVVKYIAAFVESSFDTAKDTFNNFRDGDVFKHVKGVVESLFDNAKAVFSAFDDGDVFKHVKGVVESAFDETKGTFDAFVDGSVFKHIGGIIESAYTNARNTFDAFRDGDVFKHIQGQVEKAFGDAKSVFDAFKDGDTTKHVQGAVESAFNSAKGTFDSFKNADVFKLVQGSVEPAFTSTKQTFDALKDNNATKHLMGQTEKSFTDAQQTFNAFTDAPVVKTIKATVEKAGTWVADAWEAAQMTASTVTKTVQGAVQKAYTWVADAWTAIQADDTTKTATVNAKVQKDSYSNSEAWKLATETAGTRLILRGTSPREQA